MDQMVAQAEVRDRARAFAQKADLLLDAKTILGEGPYWHAEQRKLYYVDIAGEMVCRFDPVTMQNEQFAIGKSVGAVVCEASDADTVIVSTRDGFERYHMGTRTLTLLADPEADLPGNRFNDGKCDSRGRFFAGTMQHVEVDVTGSLYVLDTDGQCRKVARDVGVSNGIAWSLDEKQMYYIDSMKQTVTAFDYDAENGELSNPRIIIDFQKEDGFPDGMTIDSEGMLWIAHWDGWQVSRWDPRTGSKLGAVYVPVAKASSCVFGGDDLMTLYITTASIGTSPSALALQPNAGGIFTYHPGVKGTSTYPYRQTASKGDTAV
ncbi:SMP-30/gluconolactonase/LRE family protein [Paenibacillus albus]|uniref:SMP-30/gluconolactonase/LRE family protein n=1 Tax=Paenibacillus albus TaxID=2495582 RepID=A0A3S9A1P1_9BACL|nr:SMP-30/gluconolactonase/LRE family protein [Paenibacillus albus]AZN39641.1 SMP-30/gluconolactonase/LRE family protein [Paenibacillus albus]